jgi:hypothetical protein
MLGTLVLWKDCLFFSNRKKDVWVGDTFIRSVASPFLVCLHLPISMETSLELESLNQVVKILERLLDPLDIWTYA